MKIFITKIVILSFMFITPIVSFAHSGRTDSNGGHYDRSTGEYHYHHGYSAHYHNSDGSCPYGAPSSVSVNSGTLTINKGTSENSTTQTNNFEAQLEEKNRKIFDLETSIEEQNQKISNLEQEKENLHILYIFAIAVLSCISYYTNKDKREQIEKYRKS